jgi:predicted aspartyl protease
MHALLLAATLTLTVIPTAHAANSALIFSPKGDSREYIKVSINSLNNKSTFTMLIDTGSDVSMVNEQTANELIKTDRAYWCQYIPITLADGSTKQEHTICIRNLTISGNKTIHDVTAVVAPNGLMILGMNVLKQFGNFTLDFQNNMIVFGENN